ncbi:5-(carboxyamino)imidazole ribonucleotide synthase [Aquibium carbonis]|uniref:N5-carboxyaminoimidazole ribonucleotide synthase n=1 Tax=Aquibium carbonis TaxID=2495581 RepID=A0A3S0A539_9HYPH|nr:5-(carboxyamino)imidazole ribonucleotide synthase [Aquibium carbonis]RST84914.1 5-(carboxyamino)imidazole ribonucleotide synthase [Aquibium carbonis]
MIRPLVPGDMIGIIGGGQLGRMLAMAAARLGFRTTILEPQPDCPAAQVSNSQILADYDDRAALTSLAARSAVVTYEFENVPVGAARHLCEHVPVFPPPLALETAQDRLAEKSFLNRQDISTARFLPVDDDADLRAALDKFGGSGVLKTRRLGYDGKGQRVFRNARRDASDGAVEAMGGVPLILEDLVAFDFEFSIIAARGLDGSMMAYDAARNEHADGILRRTTVPAGIDAQMEKTAREATFALMDALGYVGVIGVEFFALADGSVLANEFAPRVHNSGHWTEAVCVVSQFEQHIRAVAGLPLGLPGRHSDCVMENLIGDDIERIPDLLGEPGVVLNLYGKTETRPGRKMGHFTRLG